MAQVSSRQWDDREWEPRLFPLLLVALGVAVGATIAGAPKPAVHLPSTLAAMSVPQATDVVATQTLKLPSEPMVQVHVADIVPSDGETNSVALLMDKSSEHVIPVFLGAGDGDVLQAELHPTGDSKSDPQGLTRQSVAALGGSVTRIEIGGDDRASVGQLVLQRGDSEIVVGARLGDALELAIASGIPVYIPTRLVTTQGISRDQVRERPDGFPSRLRAPERL